MILRRGCPAAARQRNALDPGQNLIALGLWHGYNDDRPDNFGGNEQNRRNEDGMNGHTAF